MLDRIARALGYVRVSEVASIDSFEAELRYVTTTEKERADLRECAILCGMAGVTAEDLPIILNYGARLHLHGFTHREVDAVILGQYETLAAREGA